jgi:rhodanese-related sulfurtransferase
VKLKFLFMLLIWFVFLSWVPAFASDQVSDVEATTLSKWVVDTKDLVLIDVGTPGDFAEGHIPGSISMPLNTTFPVESKKLSKGKTYVLVCPTGGRSARAARLMKDNGFEKVYNLKGGVTDWLRKGFKVEKGA